MITKSKKRKISTGFKETDMVERPEGLDSNDLKDLVRYDAYTRRYPHPSDMMRSTWSRKALGYIRIFLAQGLSKIEIINRLGTTEQQYDKLEQEIIEVEGGQYASMGAAHRYYMFILRQELSLRYLDKFIEANFMSKDIIPAIKAKSAILSDIIRIGQELGVVDKRAKELRVLGNINLSSLPTEQLEKLYKEKLSVFGEVVGANSKALTGPHAKIVEQALSEIEAEALEMEDAIQDADYEMIG